MPSDTLVTLQVEDQEINVLLSRLIQGASTLDHPQVQQVNPIPDTEWDMELDMEIAMQPGRFVESDPNIMKSEDHLLRPLASRAAMHDNQELVR